MPLATISVLVFNSLSHLFSKVEASQTRQSFSSINPSMALKLSPFTTPSLKSPSFSVPQMASVRSSKFAMASTLRSNSKSVLSFYSLSLFSLVFLCKFSFFLFSDDFGSGFVFSPLNAFLHLGRF